jgi:rod shape-determining protein MreC
MLRLFSFFSKNKNLLLFLFLEAIAFWLVVRYNEPQRHVFGDQVLSMSGEVQNRRARVSHYFSLGEANDQLQEENEKLRSSLDQLRVRQNLILALSKIDSSQQQLLDSLMSLNDSLTHPKTFPVFRQAIEQLASVRQPFVDSLASREIFDYLPCRAIRNTTNQNYNYIALDKGYKQGARVGMGLVSPQGIAGVVIRTGQNFSLALSVLNVSFRLSAQIEGKPTLGSFEWNGKDPQYGTLRFIPLNVEIERKVDGTPQPLKVVTSGNSTRFPPGFVIGQIAEIKEDSQVGFYEIRVKLATDFQALHNLYMVSARHKAQLDSLYQDLKQ